MTDNKGARLSKLARDFNVGISTIVDFLKKKGYDIEANPNTKVADNIVSIIEKEYSSDVSVKKESEKLNLKNLRDKKETITLSDVDKKKGNDEEEEEEGEEVNIVELKRSSQREELRPEVKVVGKIDLNTINKPKVQAQVKPVVVEPKIEIEVKVEKAPEEIIVPIEKITPSEPIVNKEPVHEDFRSKNAIEENLKVVGKINLDEINLKTRPAKKSAEERDAERRQGEKEFRSKQHKIKEVSETKVEEAAQVVAQEVVVESTVEAPIVEVVEDNMIKTRFEKLAGPTILGKIELPSERKVLVTSAEMHERDRKKKRKRIKLEKERVSVDQNAPKPQAATPAAPGAPRTEKVLEKKDKKKVKKVFRTEVNEEDVQKQIKDTLARLTTKGKSKAAKYRREKREEIRQRHSDELEQQELDKSILKVTEFVTVAELASMMDVQATQVISTCMSLGLFVSINQRLDAETISIVAEEFNFKVEFVSIDIQEAIEEVIDAQENLLHRPPIVTVMGHVDHGKTKLLDYIRSANVVAGEAGGITQHIGAYHVELEDGRAITFLDTPGHEAFTAMRARGAKVTDVAIIVVAADDGIMPQTREAINHAQAAGVPLVFAINKIDKPSANPEKIKEELANMNLLVEDWGGKIQSQEISAKTGLNIQLLLDKVLLEAEMLDLKANPNRLAKGTVIESTLDKGRGYVATVLVETGTMKIGDILLAGTQIGRVKAMYNERNKRIDTAGPSTPVLILGLNGAPQAGDDFHVMADEKEAKEIAVKREQLQREQGLRTKKHITLDEIGRRIAIGNFKELNVIVKGDVDGSVEALADSLIKLSTEEIQVNVIHKAVGQITESDILLAAASNAVVLGFQVRPSVSARKIAEKEQIEIRLYSIIYNAIEELKDAMEGMLSPEIKEEIVATLEVREAFNITKVGTVAGCYVREGKITRNTKVRVIRDGIVVHTGELGSLKRFKDDVKEVLNGFECGLNLVKFNDIQVGDTIEGYKEVEVKKTL